MATTNLPVNEDSRYRLLIEAITDYAVYMLDIDGIVRSWNPGAERFKGYTAAEIIGQHFSRFYTAEDNATGLPARALRTAAEQGKFEAEGWRVRKDGSRFWAYVVIDPIKVDGELLGFAKITRDLTERKLAEETLRRTQEQFRLLVQGVTDYAIYMLDERGIVTNWNAGAERIKGYAPAEIIGQHFSRFYTDADRETGEPGKALETARRDGKYEREAWRVRKDGSRFFAHVIIDAIRDDAGKVIAFAKITRDITDRKQAEETLRQSQEQFRLLVQGVTDYAIYMLSPDGIVTNWNAGAESIKGYTPTEIIGRHFSQFYTKEDRLQSEPEKALATARRNGRFEKEGWRLRKDGTRFFAHVIIDAIRDDKGELIGFAKITRDITERMEQQRKLEKTREALLQSQKMDAIGRLTGGIAHDFNNLLMAISSSLSLMRKRMPDDPKLKSLLETAVQGAERGTALTKRMLAFARRQDLKQEPVDIPELVRGMTDMLHRTLGASLEIETRFPLVSRPAMADANQLEMALLNLAVNARDAMPAGGQLVISSRERNGGPEQNLKPGAYVVLSIADTGMGMDAKTLSQAIEPFFTTKGPGKGTGLGLPMVLGLAEQSGGRFILSSKPGEGTTAELWLPVAIEGSDQIHETHADSPARIATGALRILAVDDDPLILMNTAAMIEDLGHNCETVSSAKQALEILHGGEKFDLVISDHAMPIMTGAQLAAAVTKEWPDIPFVLATGYAELEGTSSQPRLPKPFGEHEIKQLIDRLFAPQTVIAFPKGRMP